MNSLWADFAGVKIWSNVPDLNLHDKVVDESFKWDWTLNPSLKFGGGSLTLDPVGDAGSWIQSLVVNGFSPDSGIFNYQSAVLTTSVTANGKTANGELSAGMSASVEYKHVMPNGTSGRMNFVFVFGLIYKF